MAGKKRGKVIRKELKNPDGKKRIDMLELVISTWISRPWWRRFLGLPPKGWGVEQ